ncbi:MAG: hypothetical protein K6D37_08350 [Prevotella sp.]|nr:hypothetical protein [Prevotella sp.]
MDYNRMKWCWNVARVLFLPLLLLLMAGCDNEDDNMGLEMEQTAIPYAESPYFFKTLKNGRIDYFMENYFVLVNSQEELMAICKDSITPPNIDFKNYSLVVGRYFGNAGYQVLISHNVVVRTAKINIRLKRIADATLAVGLYYHFWALRPKIVCDSVEFIVSVDR